VIVLSSDGSAFQALGAVTMNALSAVRVLVLGMTKSPRLSDDPVFRVGVLAKLGEISTPRG